MACNCIFLSRHGQSEYMLRELLGGNPPLTAKGRAYAQQLPELILPLLPQDAYGQPLPVPVLTSTLQRTIQTASCLPFTQQRLRELDEINAGVCEHMTYEQVAHTYPHIHEARARDKLGYRYPEGESYLDLVARLWPVVHQLEQRTSPVVVVAHQAVLRVVVGLLLRKPLQDLPTLAIPLHTVMQLTPTAPTKGSSSPYDMQLIRANITLPATPAAAPSAMSTPAADCMSPAVPIKVEHNRTDSGASTTCCAGFEVDHWSMNRSDSWASCSSEMEAAHTAAPVLTEQHA